MNKSISVCVAITAMIPHF